MKKVLIPRVRFKGFDEEWSEERIENLSSFRRGSRVSHLCIKKQTKYSKF
ncbi:hypothetical protein RRG50_04820 [Mycoplasmopsis felis]|nr:hypothetical protein [Mycoplasmopsis felis]WQQ10666.1 hypothetical protein RRG45_02745 [Mycoplasmopsis felis]